MKTVNDACTVVPTETDILQTGKDKWEPPPNNRVKLNFDGAAGTKGYASSAVARDSEPGFKGCQSKVFSFTSAVEVEAHGANLAVNLAIRKGLKDIIIERDSLIVINSFKYMHYQYPWRIHNSITRIRDNLYNFNTVEFQLIHNKANNVAHQLVAYVVTNQSSGLWLTSPPPCISQLIETEATFSV
ncbi:uncharacterized protein LOC113351577 [Papaver somniferum]|uniref:uncharacterized protein LOC113351577 n=1 Tax=Papaver somniferum TaxID=3469 RepID=UPI000E703FDD|nr:uncharacterized protein LOC113351577 [Papaver somniferum]